MTSVQAELTNQLGTVTPMTPGFPSAEPDSTGSPSIHTAEKCLKTNIESIARCVELSHSSDMYIEIYARAGNVGELFSLLINNLGTKYLETALDKYLPLTQRH